MLMIATSTAGVDADRVADPIAGVVPGAVLVDAATPAAVLGAELPPAARAAAGPLTSGDVLIPDRHHEGGTLSTMPTTVTTKAVDLSFCVLWALSPDANPFVYNRRPSSFVKFVIFISCILLKGATEIYPVCCLCGKDCDRPYVVHV